MDHFIHRSSFLSYHRCNHHDLHHPVVGSSTIDLPTTTKGLIWNWFAFNIAANLFFCALFSQFLEKYNCGTKVQIRVVFAMRMIIYLGVVLLFLGGHRYFVPILGLTFWELYVISGCCGFYVALAVLDQLWLKKWSKKCAMQSW